MKTRKRRERVGLWLALVFAVGCVSVEAGAYTSDCITVTAGSFEIDCDTGAWSFSGLCAKVKHSACPSMSRFVFKAGADANGNGVLDEGEETISVDDSNPGTTACAGSGGGNLGGAGSVIWHYEVWTEDQPDSPKVSRTGEAKKK